MEGLTCTVVGNGVLGRKTLEEGSSFLFHAGNIRKERTGLHAKISLGIGDIILGDDTFNVDRLGDRSKLAKYVFEKMSNGYKAAYPLDVLTHDLDGFCRQIWHTWVSTIVAEERGGSAEREAAEWLIYPYVIKGGGTIIYAPPGAGKSATGQTMAVSLDAGIDEIFDVRVPAKVLYVNLERSQREMDRRVGDINNILGFGRDRPLLRLDKRGWSVESVAEAVEETVKRHAVGCVCWDSLSRVGTGALVKDEAANKAMDIFNSLSESWIALGHTSRATDEHVFGSQMYDAAADVMVKLTSVRTETGLGVGLQITKANDIGRMPMQAYAYDFDRMGLIGVKPAKIEDFPMLKAGRVVPPDERIQDWLLDNGKASATIIARELEMPRSTVATILGGDKRRFVVVEHKGREVIYGAAHGS